MLRVFIATVSLAALTATAVLADSGAPVYCGSFTCFEIHSAALGKGPDARANDAMDVINKYLGGSVGRVSMKPQGKNVRLLLNGDTVAVVTQADASAERQKSPAAVAQKWSASLTRAFQQSKAQK